MKILQKEITGTQTSFSPNFGSKLSFILSFLFSQRLHCSYIYFHCSYLYNYYNYSQTSYPYLIKFPYFVDTSERGDRGVKQRVSLWITLVQHENFIIDPHQTPNSTPTCNLFVVAMVPTECKKPCF
jgi:hypothetical protein